jgi:hypothetical protein
MPSAWWWSKVIYTQAEAARSLEINTNMLGRWIRENETAVGHAFRSNGKLTPEQAEIRQLREENRRLKMEKDILKKGGGRIAAPLLCQRSAVKCVFITQHKRTWPVDVMSRLLGVSRNAYYRHCQQDRQPDPEYRAILWAAARHGP